MLVCVAFSSLGCEGPPARAKPWRHAAEPRALDAGSDVAAAGRARAEALATHARTLTIRLAAEPTSLHPILQPDRETLEVVEDTIYETLVRRAPDGTIVPGLAESYRVVGNEIRFALRRDVTFQDGTPFTATDAQKSITLARRSTSRLRPALAQVIAAEVWGPRDLRLVLARPDAYALRALAEVPVLPAHIPAETLATSPVGTGPYRLERWDHGERIVLARWDGYRGGPPPAIPAVEYTIEPDGARALLLLRRGDLDVIPAIVPEHWPDAIKSGGGTFEIVDLAPPRYLALALNLRRPPFDDARVRRAALLLVDRARLAREDWRGLARPVATPVWPGGLGDATGPAAEPYDPVRGMLLLDEAGWRTEKDGVRARDGVKLRVKLLDAGDPAAGGRELILAGLRRAGFGVEIETLPPAELILRMRTADFDAGFLDDRGRVDEDICALFVTGGPRNFGGYSSPLADAACGSARAAFDPLVRRAAISNLAAVVAADQPHLPLLAPQPKALVSARVAGLVVDDGWFRVRDLRLVTPPG